MTNGQRIMEVNGVDLCVDAAGNPAGPTILLISGMGGSMDWWEDEFCQRLVAGYFFRLPAAWLARGNELLGRDMSGTPRRSCTSLDGRYQRRCRWYLHSSGVSLRMLRASARG